MEIEGRIWIKKRGKNFLGHGKIELLELINKSGSISKAAQSMHMSYKAAWDSINLINTLSSEPLVRITRGGKNGGGAKLTQKGLDFIKIFRKMEQINKSLFHIFESDLDSIDNLGLENIFGKNRYSNSITGDIIEKHDNLSNIRIAIRLNDGQIIRTNITQNSDVTTNNKYTINIDSIIVFTSYPNCISNINVIKGKINKAINKNDQHLIEIAIGNEILTTSISNNHSLKKNDPIWLGIQFNDISISQKGK